MDFFSLQDDARRRTGVLVVCFGLAVASIVVALFGAAVLVIETARDARTVIPLSTYVLLFFGIAVCTSAVIFGGSLYKIYELRAGGGPAVARMLGGTPISPDGASPQERMLLNIVEEMAIASGTAVPEVYVLGDEKGINAFAAGYTSNDAVVAVTQGTLDHLSRDELQGVIAHEFSHILNGDMALNLRLMGILHGILLIALIGYGLIRTLEHASPGPSSAGRKTGGRWAVAMLLAGLAMIVVGSIGVFFGKLIKSAVSRQREFLADASAVQFTRNPSGLAGALRKIGGLYRGSRIMNVQAESAGHLFFGNAVRDWLGNLTATHPPLEKRILRLDPSFDGTFPKMRIEPAYPEAVDGAEASAGAGRLAGAGSRSSIAITPEGVTAAVGALSPAHVLQAASLIASIPPDLTAAARTPAAAAAAVFGILLHRDPEVQASQNAILEARLGEDIRTLIRNLGPAIEQLTPEMRLPLLQLAVPTLRRLPEDARRKICEIAKGLCGADRYFNVFDYAVQRVLVRQLRSAGEPAAPRRVQHFAVASALPACAGLLSTLAYLGRAEPDDAVRAFDAGVQRLGVEALNKLQRLPREATGPAALDAALDTLAAASPGVKRRVLQACAACIGADGRIDAEEAELLRIVAIALDCPMQRLDSEAA